MGSGADERTFNALREIRAENDGVTLQAFKQIVREQHFYLQLDRDKALAAIPKMLSGDRAIRSHTLEALRRTAKAAGALTGEQAQRLAQVEKLFSAGPPRAAASRQAAVKAAPKPPPKAVSRAKAAARKAA
jgi:hypothetical protein